MYVNVSVEVMVGESGERPVAVQPIEVVPASLQSRVRALEG